MTNLNNELSIDDLDVVSGGRGGGFRIPAKVDPITAAVKQFESKFEAAFESAFANAFKDL
jgi:hypothetical protein